MQVTISFTPVDESKYKIPPEVENNKNYNTYIKVFADTSRHVLDPEKVTKSRGIPCLEGIPLFPRNTKIL